MTDDLRRALHAQWASVATSWSQHADYVDARSASLTDAMLALAQLSPGERVLELACGPGGVGLAAAIVAGEVVLSDVAEEMVEVALARADAAGVHNVEGRVRDLEAIDEPDESFDAVLCREGLMFALEPARATAEMHRVLRPGGRAVVAVWGARERNPWLGVMLDAVGEQLGMPIPPPGIPGPFALGDDGALEAAMRAGGFDAVVVEEHELVMRAPTVGEWWTRTRALAGPVANLVAGLPDDARAELDQRIEAAAAPYRSGDGVEFPGMSLVARALRS